MFLQALKSIDIDSKEIHFCFALSSLSRCHAASLFTSDERKVWFLTYLTLLTNTPALLMTSLIQTAGHKMAALTGVVSRLWNVDFYQTGPEIGWKIAVWGGDSSVVRAPDSWSKGRGFESLLDRREHFLLQGQLSVLTLISVSVPPPCYLSST